MMIKCNGVSEKCLCEGLIMLFALQCFYVWCWSVQKVLWMLFFTQSNNKLRNHKQINVNFSHERCLAFPKMTHYMLPR